MVQNTLKMCPNSDKNEPKSSQMGPCGPLLGLGALLWATGTSKSRLFGHIGLPLGSLWAARGAIWTPLGVVLGTFVCQKSSFFCHVMSRPTFCIILGCFLEYFGSILGVIWVELEFQIAFDLEKSSYTRTYVFPR